MKNGMTIYLECCTGHIFLSEPNQTAQPKPDSRSVYYIQTRLETQCKPMHCVTPPRSCHYCYSTPVYPDNRHVYNMYINKYLPQYL